MPMRPTSIVTSFIITIAVFGLFPHLTGAIGISPAVIEVENMVPHMQTTKEIWFSRGDAEQTEMLDVTFSGPAANYITPTEADSVLTFPAGEKMLKYPITIHTDNLASGQYEVVLTVTPHIDPAATAAAGSTQVLAGAEGLIRFTVTGSTTTDQYVIDQVQLLASVTGEPLKLIYYLDNKTNLDIKPNSIQLTATSLQTGQATELIVSSSDIPTVPALTAGGVTLELAWDLPADDYIVNVTFHDQTDAVVGTVSQIPVTLVSAEALAQSPVLVDAQQNTTALQAGQGILEVALTFENQDNLSNTVTPMVDIYRDGRFITTLEADPLALPPNGQAQSIIRFQPRRFGRYTTQAYGIFSAKRTNSVDARFTVYALWPIVSASIGGSTLLVVLALLMYRALIRKRSVNTSVKRSPPPPKKRQ